MRQDAPATRQPRALEREFETNRFAKDRQAQGYEEVLPVVHRRLSREPETPVMVMALDEGPEQEEQLSRKEVAA